MEQVLVEKLHQIAEEVNKKQMEDFWTEVENTTQEIIKHIENNLLIEAQKGKFEYTISISNFCKDIHFSFDNEEFINEVSTKLSKYWKSRGFKAPPSIQNLNEFTISW